MIRSIFAALFLLLLPAVARAQCNPANSPTQSPGCWPQAGSINGSTDYLLGWQPGQFPASAVRIPTNLIPGIGVLPLANGGTGLASPFGTTATTFARGDWVPGINVLQFHSGGCDWTCAFQAALSSLPSSGGKIILPPGLTTMSGPVIYTMPSNTASLTIEGWGSDQSVLSFPGNGLTITYIGSQNAVHMKGFTIAAAAVGTSTGITLTQQATIGNPANTAVTELQDLAFRGADGYLGSDYWKTGIRTNSVSNINLISVSMTGNSAQPSGSIGVDLEATATSNGVVYNFIGCTINWYDKGMNVGPYIQGVVWAGGGNMVADNYGIYIGNSAGTAQMTVADSAFNDLIAGYYDAGGVFDTVISNNLFYVPSAGEGIKLNAYSTATLANNAFDSTTAGSGTGIIFGPGTGVASISGGSMHNLNLGIWLPAGSNNVTVSPNIINDNTTTMLSDSGAGNMLAVGGIGNGYSVDTGGRIKASTLNLGANVSTGDVTVNIGGLRTGAGNAYADFTAETGDATSDTRLLRSTGGNGNFTIEQAGTGAIVFSTNAAVGNAGSGGTVAMSIDNAQTVAFSAGIKAAGLPTSCSGKPTGTIWNNSNVLNVCP